MINRIYYESCCASSTYSLLDTSVGTFLGPPLGSTAAKYLKWWSEEGTDSGIEETMCYSHNKSMHTSMICV